MKGIPVPIENRVPRDDWDRAPWNRWAFQNVRQLVPTAEVWRGKGSKWELSRRLRDLNDVGFDGGDGHHTTLKKWLERSYTDGFMVTYSGEIVYERYLNNMTERTLHLSQSVAKSIVGSVAGILIGKGSLDPEKPITEYLPELEWTGWKDATVQQVMDMTTGVRYIEDYEAHDSDIAMTDIASGWKAAPHGVTAPASIWEQILGLTETVRPHGELFSYRSIETDVLAHCLERITDYRLPELVSRLLWQPLGCEESASFTVDSAGYGLANGGFNASLRDYARFGLMLAQGGRANGNQIVPESWVNSLHKADNHLFHAPYTNVTPHGGYRNQFWVEDVNRNAFMARGVFGQLIYVDMDSQVVVVKLSSWPEFVSDVRLRSSLNAVRAIAEYLNS